MVTIKSLVRRGVLPGQGSGGSGPQGDDRRCQRHDREDLYAHGGLGEGRGIGVRERENLKCVIIFGSVVGRGMKKGREMAAREVRKG